MDAAQQVINQKVQEFLATVRGGKIEWKPEEVSEYFLERKKIASKITVPAHGLGPADPARAAALARAIIGAFGGSLEITGNGYKLDLPASTAQAIPMIIEKPSDGKALADLQKKLDEAEKALKAAQAASKDSNRGSKPEGKPETELHFPPTPNKRKALANFQQPDWYTRMVAALDAGKHVALAGPPGIGKSTAPEQYFIAKGQDFCIVNGDAGFRRRDIEGTTEISNGTTFFHVAEFAAAAINGWACILNEVNAADPDALIWINGVLEEKIINLHGKMYPVHPNFRLVVTYNPGLVGTKALPQAFKDRFFPVKLGFPKKDLLKRIICAKTGVNEFASYMNSILRFAEEAWAAQEKGTLRYQLSPRRLFDAVFLLDKGTTSSVKDAIRWAVIDAVDSNTDIQALNSILASAVP